MTPDEFKAYIQSTYRTDEFDYRISVRDKICNWGEWKQDSIAYFKSVLSIIKNDEKKKRDKKDNKKEKGWYASVPITKDKRTFMVIFFEYPDTENKRDYYSVYDFKIKTK
jgi:hypothetical protein